MPHIKNKKVEAQIKANDKDFDRAEIIAWSKKIFTKLQRTWTQKEWEEIRIFETNRLFEQHKIQAQGYKNNYQINIVEVIGITKAYFSDYRIAGDKEILEITLKAKMKDYIIDETSKQVLMGNPKQVKINKYLLAFERKYGTKTKQGPIKINSVTCHNCGAPTKITSAGACEYCGSVITTEDYNWCLANLERLEIKWWEE